MAEVGSFFKKASDEELDFQMLVIYLWQNKFKISAITIVVTILGIVYSLLAPESYVSEAIIAPMESQKEDGATSILSKFGGIGGIVGSQLGTGNTKLDRIEIMLKSRTLAKKIIEKHDLMPKLYPGLWDSTTGKWRSQDDDKIPKLRDGVKYLREQLLSVSVDVKKSIITIQIKCYDPLIASEILWNYLKAINDQICEDTKDEADSNRTFLMKVLGNTSDPILKEKIQNMIAFEIEKSMLISSKSIKILEEPNTPWIRSAPQRKKIVIISFFMGIFISLLFLILYSNFKNVKKKYHSLNRE